MTTLSERTVAPALSMPVGDSPGEPAGAGGGRFLPLLVVLFVGSGCAALIYEVVWLQLLQLVIGASAISLGVLLGTFMGGMCLGSLLLSKFVSRRHHPLRVYAALELLIGLCGLGVLFAVPRLGDLYTHLASPGAASVMLRAVIAGICLVPPTLLMGATLPAIARYVEATPRGVSWLGFFYGGNILGAVCGCLLAGFYLLRLYDMPTATEAAFCVNVTVSVLAFLLSLVAAHKPVTKVGAGDREDAAVVPEQEQGPAWLIYVVIGISGMTGLGAEVVWTRLLSLMLGATVYTFSIILAVFLLGLGIGSTAGAAIARNTKRPRTVLGAAQFLLALAICWTAYAVARSLPFWPEDPSMKAVSVWVTFQMDISRALFAILPSAIFWGASFPLALAAVPARRGSDPGSLVGRVYAANTVGAILGSLGFSMVLIPWIGTQEAEQLLVGLTLVSAVVAMIPGVIRRPQGAAAGLAGTVVAAALGVFLMLRLPGVPWTAVAWGRYSATDLADDFPAQLTDEEMGAVLRVNQDGLPLKLDKAGELTFVHENAAPTNEQQEFLRAHKSVLISALKKEAAVGQEASTLSYSGDIPDRYCTFVGEGMNVSVAVTYTAREDGVKTPDGIPSTYRYFHGAGKVQASSIPADMRLQRSLGHLTALVHGNPENVLVVACGAGVTAGSFVPYDSVKHITICDIEPMVPKYVAPMFAQENYNVVGDPRTTVVLDDGRHFVRTTKEKFDVITSDPIDPWVKGCAALNTVEYYEMCKEHLKPGGVMALWIPLYENSEESAKSIIATFFKVFPNGILWSNDLTKGEGYDAVLFGTVEPTVIDVDKMGAYLDAHPKVKESLTDVKFGKESENDEPTGTEVAVDLLSSFAADAHHLKPWTDGAQLNEDNNLRLQYLAGLALNEQMAPEILRHIMSHYEFPAEIFHGNAATLEALQVELSTKGRVPRGGGFQE
jgi:spermidine synthase